MRDDRATFTCRGFIAAGVAAAALPVAAGRAGAADAPAAGPGRVVTLPAGKKILLSCKPGMIAEEVDGKKLSLADRLALAGRAGFDGVDLDGAGGCSPEEARTAVTRSGVFVHDAIIHAHGSQRLTSSKAEERDRGRANLEHCLRVSHAAGGSGVLIVVGHGDDGPAEVVEERARGEIRKLLPLAAASRTPPTGPSSPSSSPSAS